MEYPGNKKPAQTIPVNKALVVIILLLSALVVYLFTRQQVPSSKSIASNITIDTKAMAAEASVFTTPSATVPDTPKPVNVRRTPVVVAVEDVSPAVVNISTEKIVTAQYNPFSNFQGDAFDQFFNDFYNRFSSSRNYKQQTLGSGVIIDSRGYILTNEHVILRASQITVTLPNEDEYEARIVGADPKFDLAILKIDAKEDLPAAHTGDSDSLMIGETAIAIGNPFGLSHTVTTGVISAVNRTIVTDDEKVFNDFIQTDASINPGNSGGPLVNLSGEIIGINTVVYANAEGIGFAIPINRAMRAVSELIRFGEIKKIWTGMRIQNLSPRLARGLGLDSTDGALIADILEDSPAENAGLESGDVVTSVNNRKIDSVEAFHSRIGTALAGESIKLAIFRAGKELEIEMLLEAVPINRAGEIARIYFGFTAGDITDKLVRKYRLRANRGAVVVSVERNSAAFEIGLQPGDIIHQIGTIEIVDLNDFNEAVVQALEHEAAFMLVQRGNYLYHIRI